jgi:serine/threonine protein phosphatase 1
MSIMQDLQIPNENTRIYAIGDIHGRLDLLERMIAAIGKDAGGSGGASLIVTLGDYVDRGPKSREVLDRLSENPFPGAYVALRGNHEALLDAFLADPKVGAHWQRLGGLQTLASFGVHISPLMGARSFDEAAARLRAALTPAQRSFLASLKMSLAVGRYFFCHAGVRPGVSLDKQSDEDLLWIRDEFLDSAADFGKIVVHGHTPVVEPDVRANRINVDTGAFATGRLTCLVLEGARHRFITA